MQLKNMMHDSHFRMQGPSPLQSLLVGSSSAVGSMAVIYPLDNLLTRQQLSIDSKSDIFSMLKKVYNEEGLKGLYNGFNSSMAGVAITWAVFYYVHEWLKIAYARKYNSKMPSVYTSLILSMVAGVMSSVASNPIWVANARQKLAKSEGREMSLMQELTKMYEEEGLAGLQAGIGLALMLVINPAIQFAIYERIKNSIVHNRREHVLKTQKKVLDASQLSAIEGFVLGAVSKIFATAFTYPLQILKVHMQVTKRNINEEKSSDCDNCTSSCSLQSKEVVRCAQEIYKTRGLRGFFAGIETKLFSTVLNSALMFMLLETIHRGIRKAQQ